MPKKKKNIVRRKWKTAFAGERYRLQTYLETSDRELVEKALEIMGEGSLSGFAARATIREARRIIAEHEAQEKPVRVAR